MYKCKYFGIKELVHPDLYAMFSNHEDLLWKMFDENLLRGIDWFRENYGVCYINTWSLSPEVQSKYGLRRFSGLRLQGLDYYSKGSMHSVAKAADMIFANISAADVRADIRNNKKSIVPYITRIEDDVTWTHIDTKPTGLKEVYFFKP